MFPLVRQRLAGGLNRHRLGRGRRTRDWPVVRNSRTRLIGRARYTRGQIKGYTTAHTPTTRDRRIVTGRTGLSLVVRHGIADAYIGGTAEMRESGMLTTCALCRSRPRTVPAARSVASTRSAGLPSDDT